MFLTADWTKPQIGGLLSEIIEKEERQLRAPKPRIEVQHVWDPDALRQRGTLWKDVQSRPQGKEAMGLARSKLGMSVPQLQKELPSRTSMIAARRTRDSLAAMDREREADAKSSEVGFKSAASLFTPEDLQQLRPIYAPNEKCATETTNQLIGLGAKRVPLNKSRYNRQQAFPPDFTSCRNNPDRVLVEQARDEAATRPKPWLTAPRREKVNPNVTITQHHIVPRSTTSSFCIRPGDLPIV